MKRVSRVIFRSMILSIVLLLGANGSLRAQNKADNTTDKQSLVQLQKLMQVYRYLDKTYVEDVDMQPIVEVAIRGMLAELDPHSSYLNAEEMKAAQESSRGEFGGIGVEYNMHNDTIIVVNTILQGPAANVGVRPNDRIVEVDGKDVVGIKRSEVPRLLRGERGSVVNVGVVRRGEPQMLNFAITRGNIPITTVDAAYKVSDSIGYVKVNRFGHTTMREFREAMAKMPNVETLILDLCGNGGGLLNQAVEMAGYFLPKGSLVLTTEERSMPIKEFRSSGEQEFRGRVIVLIDESSASGSEVVAGALQDWDRALIVGRNSYGKGLVQREIPFSDGSAIRLTVARYHTPSGRVIQRPYKLGHKEDYDKAFVERLRQAASGADSLQQDSVELPRYVTLQNGRTIYGGGGIAPDVRVGVDTTRVSDYASKLIMQGVNVDFVVEYMDKNRQSLAAQYPTFAKFEADFALSDDDMQKVVELASVKGVEFNQAEYENSLELLHARLTAQIAHQLFSMSEFYQYINVRANASFKTALRLANNWSSEVEPRLGVR